MSTLVGAYRQLDPFNEDADMCRDIAAATNDYRQSGPLRVDKFAARTKPLTKQIVTTKIAGCFYNIRNVVKAAHDADVMAAFDDFNARFKLVFSENVAAGHERWLFSLSSEQLNLLGVILHRLRDELWRARESPRQQVVILLSRTPYALYEKLRVSWQHYVERHLSGQHGVPPHQSELPFPSYFLKLYPERIELAALVNNTPSAVWPTRGDLEHPQVGGVQTWAQLKSLLDQSIDLASTRSAEVEAFYHGFWRDQTETCLAMLRSEEAGAWFEMSAVESKKFFVVTALHMRATAQVFGLHFGALWAIRHLHQYTAAAAYRHLVETVGPHTLPFFGSHRAHVSIQQYHKQLRNADSIAQSLGNFRRNLIYGRTRSFW